MKATPEERSAAEIQEAAAELIRLTETVKVTDLKPHPRNYRVHPADQIAHVAQSIREHGLYRNVVVAEDLTILAGHGVVLGAKEVGLEELPVVRLPIGPDDPKALKILTGDNELGLLAEVDDRGLSELLKDIMDQDVAGLLGTGYDEQMLANLVMVTRPLSEIRDLNAAAQWVGLPDYDRAGPRLKLIITFVNQEDRAEFVEKFDLKMRQMRDNTSNTWATVWPWREIDDAASLMWTTADD